MMNEQEFWAALAPLPEPPPPTYRLYYGEQGEPLFYSMEDVPGKYVTVDKEIFVNPPPHVRVVDEQLKIIKTAAVTRLQPNGTGTACHPDNVSIVVDESEPHIKWSKQ
jgi:hypothetical protein